MLFALTALVLASCKRERASFCQIPYPVHDVLDVALLDAGARSRYDALVGLARDDSCRRGLHAFLCYETFPGCIEHGVDAQPPLRSCRELCELVASCGVGVPRLRDCERRALAWPDGGGAVAAVAATPRCLHPEDSHFSPHDGEGFPDPARFDRALHAARADLSLVGLADGHWMHVPPLPQLLHLRGATAFGGADAAVTWADSALLDFALQRFAAGRRLLELCTGAGFGSLRLGMFAGTRLGARQRRVRSIDVAERRHAAARRGWPDNVRFELAPAPDSGAAAAPEALRELLRRALQPEPSPIGAVPVDAIEAETLGALLVINCINLPEQPPQLRKLAVGAALAALSALGAASVGAGDAPSPVEPLVVMCVDVLSLDRAIATAVAAGGVVELHSELRAELGSKMRILRRRAVSSSDAAACTVTPRINVATAFKQYWGWPESALRDMPEQCRGRCELVADSSDAELLLFPAHAFDPDGPLDAHLTAGQRALLVCQEPWCHNWANRTHPRVAAVIGYHRDMTFWLPSRCPELLDLARRGPPPPARSQHGAKVAAFVSNCHTPVRQAVLEALMQAIPVDSYGQCLHNADFNTTVEHGFFGARTYYQKHEAARGELSPPCPVAAFAWRHTSPQLTSPHRALPISTQATRLSSLWRTLS